MEKNALVGHTLETVWLTKDKLAIKFVIEGGKEIIARVYGDCCSTTWVENIEAPEILIGAEVLTVENIDMPDLGSPDEYDVVAYYGLKIVTNRGHCVIDYRNNSNGYYGGDISWPGDYYYAGVHDQNEPDLDWDLIAGKDTE